MKMYFWFAVMCINIVFVSCNQNVSNENKEEAQELSAYTEIAASSPESDEKIDTARKFVHTANLRFKVKNVSEATHSIEQTVQQMGGFVTHSELQNNEEEKLTTRISADSSMITTKFVLANTMTIRIPSVELDNFLHTIAPLFVYLENRTIKAEDVSMQFLANKLALKRANNHGKKIATALDEKGTKLGDIVYAEKSLSSGQENTDEAKVAMRNLEDQMNFSTVDLVMYQNQTMHAERIFTPALQEPYEPSLFLKMGESLKGGWEIMEHIILFFTQLWGLFLLAGIGFFVYRFINKRLQASATQRVKKE